jgi:hypothetical protein
MRDGQAVGNGIPPLKPHEGSWAVVDRHTGQAVMEIFRGSHLVKMVDLDKFRLVPIASYLASLNRH